MAWPNKKAGGDPLDVRSRELADQIRKLERQIRQLSEKPPPAPSRPARAPASKPASARSATPSPRLATVAAPASGITPAHAADARVNPQGIRKFDLASLWHRLHPLFRGPNTHNPRMVQYLAAGSVHGLRPLRYEKRVARNRFIGLFILLVLILFGLARVYLPRG